MRAGAKSTCPHKTPGQKSRPAGRQATGLGAAHKQCWLAGSSSKQLSRAQQATLPGPPMLALAPMRVALPASMEGGKVQARREAERVAGPIQPAGGPRGRQLHGGKSKCSAAQSTTNI